MSPLNSSNVDSQGIKFKLNNSNGIRTATIINQKYETGRNIGLFAYYVGKGFMIQSLLYTNLYIDAHNVPNGTNSNICMWQNTSSDKNRSWTIDENGRLVSLKYPGWCCYITSTDSSDSAGARITMKQISTLDPNDEKQYWGFDGTHIYLASAPEKWWDLANGTNANGTFIALRQNEYSDARRHWKIIPDIRYNEYSALIFKRGVMDTNGVIYKLTGMTDDALTNNVNYSSISFPQHNINEFAYQINGFPPNLTEVQFRDQILKLSNKNTINVDISDGIYISNKYYKIANGNQIPRVGNELFVLTGSTTKNDKLVVKNDDGTDINIEIKLNNCTFDNRVNWATTVKHANMTLDTGYITVKYYIEGTNIISSQLSCEFVPGRNTTTIFTSIGGGTLTLTNSYSSIGVFENFLGTTPDNTTLLIDENANLISATLKGIEYTNYDQMFRDGFTIGNKPLILTFGPI